MFYHLDKSRIRTHAITGILLFMATCIYTHLQYITAIVKLIHENYTLLKLKQLGEASL